MQDSNEGHVAVLAFPFGTHATPLLTLVLRLSAESPNLKFSFLNTSISNTKIFSRIKQDEYPNIKQYNVDDGVPKGNVFYGNSLEAVDHFLRVMMENFKTGMNEAVDKTGARITCLLTDAFFWFAADMADEMGVPWVAFWTAAPCSISIHMYTDFIRSTLSGNPENGEETLKFIPGMSSIQAKDTPVGIIHGKLDSPFNIMLHKMGLTMPRATALALNSFEEIDPIITNDLKSKVKMVLNIGPIDLTTTPKSFLDESGCLSWLDSHEKESVVYLSFGTLLTPPPNELIALAEALETQKVTFLWSFKDSSKLLPLEGFLQRTGTVGKIVPWSPQLQVLQHPSVGVFVTHGGWNSILESISGGVPMICRPFFGDQGINSRLVEEVWKIGLTIEDGNFTKSGTMKAMNLILFSKEGRKMRENIGNMKERAKSAVGIDGNSTKNFKSLLKVVSGSMNA